MAEFLSDAWVAALDEAGRGTSVPDDLRIVVQQVVVDDAGAELAAYAVRVEDGVIRAALGRAPDADVTFTQDRATAEAIARGELSAQAAFLDGRLRMGGELPRALEGARQLAGLLDVFAPARAGTTW